MKLSDFDFDLPQEYIAQTPLGKRDASKLMVLHRENNAIEHKKFADIADLLDENTVLVLNESRVIPARLRFKLGESEAEILLIKPFAGNAWECMVRPGKKFKEGTVLNIDEKLKVEVKEVLESGLRIIAFECNNFTEYLKERGQMPLPPYITEKLEEKERYQTVYSDEEGSVAAPTAGLHFTPELLEQLEAKGVQIEKVLLHVGLGTFLPVKTDDVEDHEMHGEWLRLDSETASRLNAAKGAGKKIVAVGTTSVRVLESCADKHGKLAPHAGETDIFITPGYKWKFVDNLITNFHLPKSTLLMLVSSLASKEFIFAAYEKAKENNYRFFSFGDAMYIC